MQTLEIRLARPEDVPDLFRMIHALAGFEGLSEQVRTTVVELERALFSATPQAYAHVAFLDGQAVGYVLLVPLPYIKRAQAKLVMEDFYVDDAYRSHGIGRRLMEAAVAFAREQGYFKLEWGVLDWNEAAHAFYQRQGGAPVTDWTRYALDL